MQHEFNHIVMKNGKSRLIGGLIAGKTVVVSIGDAWTYNYFPTGCSYFNCESFQSLADEEFNLHVLNNYDTIIFYSNEIKNKSIGYLEYIHHFVDLEKCVYMFSSEM